MLMDPKCIKCSILPHPPHQQFSKRSPLLLGMVLQNLEKVPFGSYYYLGTLLPFCSIDQKVSFSLSVSLPNAVSAPLVVPFVLVEQSDISGHTVQPKQLKQKMEHCGTCVRYYKGAHRFWFLFGFWSGFGTIWTPKTRLAWNINKGSIPWRKNNTKIKVIAPRLLFFILLFALGSSLFATPSLFSSLLIHLDHWVNSSLYTVNKFVVERSS